MRHLLFPVMAGMLISMADVSFAGEDTLERACKEAITKKYPQWRVAGVTSDVAQWAGSQKFDPVKVSGDFDGDGRLDLALLIEEGAKPSKDRTERRKSLHIAVCMNRPEAVVLFVIDKPYCDDYIALSRKGQEYYDFDTNRKSSYPRDGIAAVCFEQAGATYIFDGTGFRQIVDSD